VSRSKIRGIGATRQAGDIGSIGMLLLTDPRHWPAEIRVWFNNATGAHGPLDVFIFDSGQVGAMYLQDAITAAALLQVDASEWHTERGFPAFVFDRARIGEISHRLGICGYHVHVLEPATTASKSPKRKRSAAVVSIAGARREAQEKVR